VTLRRLRWVVGVVFVGGIAGMIAGSIADNNGAALTAGLITGVAALCLILATAVSQDAEAGGLRFDDAGAAELERRIGELVEAGADEDAVRDLVRESVRLGRTGR
jgi:hypothetical protein